MIPKRKNRGDFMNVLIASDKFKGSLTALQVCTIIQKELMSLHPQWKKQLVL